MPVLEFPAGHRIGIDPVHVAPLRDPAARHASSRPTGSPSRAHAVSAWSAAMGMNLGRHPQHQLAGIGFLGRLSDFLARLQVIVHRLLEG